MPAVCPLCSANDESLVFRNPQLRIIEAQEPNFPAFYRVVWNVHVAEFSDLNATQRAACMQAVMVVEQVLRQVLQPTKINLAALGNAVPHLHWHVVARFDWDTHFPGAVWASALREADPKKLAMLSANHHEIKRLICAQMASDTPV